MLRYRVVMGYPRAQRLALIICVCTIVLACTRARLVMGAPEMSGVASSPSANVQQNRFYDSGKNKEDKGDLDGALADYNRAIEQNPKDSHAYVARGVVRVEKGDREGVLADFNRAIQLEPNYAPAYYDRAIVEQEEGNVDVALKDCNRAVELDPKDPNAYRIRGDIRLKNDDDDGAIADFDRAVALDPEDSEPYARRGICKLRQKRYRDAIADLDAAIKLNAKDPEAFLLRGHAHSAWADELSAADAKRQSSEAAVEDYTRSIELSRTAPSFYFRSGEYEQLKRYDEALKDAEEAVRLDPKNASYFYQRGRVYRRTHHESLALNDFRRALELDPGNKDYAEAARPGEDKADSSQLTTGEKIAIGAGAAAGALWLLNKALSHDDAAPREEELQKIIAASGTKVRCPKCNGSGRMVRRVLEWVVQDDFGWKKPEFPYFPEKKQEWTSHKEKCDRCDGKGWVDK